MQNINLERTRGPRRRTPWWIYIGAVILAGLLIWGVVKVLPSKDKTAEEELVASDEMIPDIAPADIDVQQQPAESSLPTSRAATGADMASEPGRSVNPSVLLLDAQAAKAQGDLKKARSAALEVWDNAPNDSVRLQAETILNEVSIELALTPRDMEEKVDYTVASGDSLDKIRKKFDTTIELIRKSNNIKGSIIRIGDRLRILQGQFSLQISKSDNDLVLMLNDKFFKRYRVGTGEYNKTPVGDFIINDRIAQPTWWRPDGKSIPYGDPDNLLGTHWLSISAKGYGIHGTWEPETIGHQSSAGCVRLLNKDIEELYTLLPVGTPVSIRD